MNLHVFNDPDRMIIYNQYRLYIIAGFWTCVCTFSFSVISMGIFFLFGIGGLVPLVMGLNKVLAGVEYSYLPLATGIVSISMIVLITHSFGYYGIIGSGETLKERSSRAKSVNSLATSRKNVF
jgi:hypothetical protein